MEGLFGLSSVVMRQRLTEWREASAPQNPYASGVQAQHGVEVGRKPDC
jgi:hypothetical protein